MVTRAASPAREASPERPRAAATCRHHWLIDAPESRTSSGECLLCRARKTFPNYLSDCLIDGDGEKFEEWLAAQARRKLVGTGDRGRPAGT